MIKFLVCAAEEEELDCARQALRAYESSLAERVGIDFLLTGVGTVSTCYRLTKKIMEAEAEGHGYTLAINIGVAGSYNMERLPIGSVAVIKKEYLGDLGFMKISGFRTLFDSKVLDANLFPFVDGALVAPTLPPSYEEIFGTFKRATGVTIQTITGNQERKRELMEKFAPDMESMEGAGFFYVCLSEHINCVELRSVSNSVFDDNLSEWSTSQALEALTSACKEFFSKI